MFEGIRELKINGKEFIFLKNLKKVFYRNGNLGVSRTILAALSKIILELILVFVFLISLLVIENVNLYLPIIGFYMATMMRVIPNINLLIKSYQKINYADSALRNLLNFFVEIPQENYNSQKIQNEIDFKKNISLRNISFGYNSDNEIFDKQI